jgi:lactoylglutathione lyase
MSLQLDCLMLYVADVRATCDFYQRAFGLSPKFVNDEGTYAQIESGGSTLAFAAEVAANLPLHLNRPDQACAAMQIAFITPDVAAAFATAVAAGATPVTAPEQKPWGQTWARVRDDNGVLIELGSPQDASWA